MPPRFWLRAFGAFQAPKEGEGSQRPRRGGPYCRWAPLCAEGPDRGGGPNVDARLSPLKVGPEEPPKAPSGAKIGASSKCVPLCAFVAISGPIVNARPYGACIKLVPSPRAARLRRLRGLGLKSPRAAPLGPAHSVAKRSRDSGG